MTNIYFIPNMYIIMYEKQDAYLVWNDLIILEPLPSPHLTPVQPRWHPPWQYPVILSQFPGIPQAMLQFCRQFTPYNPIEHSGQKNQNS